MIGEINLGATYDLGRFSFGASWAHDYRKALPSTDIVASGLVYRIVRGVTVGADLAHYGRPRCGGEVETTALPSGNSRAFLIREICRRHELATG